MSRSLSWGKRRVLLVAAMASLLGLSCTAASASAANVTVNCTELPGALKNASAGEVITLNQLCTNGFPYKLPEVPVTLAGTPGAGFNGGSTAQLEGTTASATIEGLLFENATNSAASSGGALSINGTGAGVTLAKDSFINNAGGEGGGARINTATSVVTVTDSTFAGNSAKGSGGGLVVFAVTANVTGDTFSANTAAPNGQGGGLFLVAGTSTLSGSQFNNNTATDSGGGAEIITQAAGGVGVTLSGNTLSHNNVADPSATSTDPRGHSGAGLALFAIGSEPTAVLQSANTFDSNSVSFKAAPVSAMGAGESVSRVALQSTGDRFTNNTLQPPSEAKNAKAEPVFGWGAGLSVVQCADTIVEPPAAPTILSTLSDAVVAGNTLISGPNANGAGIYVGFACANAYTALQLNDSTIAGNVVSGASGPVAGISGGPRDVLSLANTIVNGDGGAELGGFQGLAGVTAAFSDVCSGVSPFAGAGNICADPKLLAPGPGSADVHETASSPTIDAGSNALVPSGLTTDAFGTTRILAGHTGCTGSFPAVVDMGAAELQSAVPSCPPPRPPARGLTHFVRLKTNAKGAALTLSCTSTDGLGCSGEIFLTTDETRQGKKVIAIGARKRTKRTKVSVRIGQAPFSLPAGGTATFQVKLNSTGLQLLRRFHTISAWVLANETMTNNSPVIFLLHSTLFSQPKHKHKSKHKSRHAKRRH
jgi:hypothetical protein